MGGGGWGAGAGRFASRPMRAGPGPLPRLRRRAAGRHAARPTLRGLRFILKFLWHLERQKWKMVASFLTKQMPCPGYTLLEQNQHFSIRMAPCAWWRAPQESRAAVPAASAGGATKRAGCPCLQTPSGTRPPGCKGPALFGLIPSESCKRHRVWRDQRQQNPRTAPWLCSPPGVLRATPAVGGHLVGARRGTAQCSPRHSAPTCNQSTPAFLGVQARFADPGAGVL